MKSKISTFSDFKLYLLLYLLLVLSTVLFAILKTRSCPGNGLLPAKYAGTGTELVPAQIPPEPVLNMNSGRVLIPILFKDACIALLHKWSKLWHLYIYWYSSFQRIFL